ncbi:hypothetical protein [Thiomonas sp.]
MIKKIIEVAVGIELALLLWRLLHLLFALVLLALVIHFTIGFTLALEFVRAAVAHARYFFQSLAGAGS